MAVLHFINKMPVEWFTKKQPTVETATYASDFMAAQTATEQIIELRTMLRYFGVPIKGETYMFGDNKEVVDKSNVPHVKLHKIHVILSFHWVWEEIAAKILYFIFLQGKDNPEDILSKSWGYQQVHIMFKAILFWEGDTIDIDPDIVDS